MHPKDSRYLLRDDFYKCVQKDWPGYSDSERQQISRMLARWVVQADQLDPLGCCRSGSRTTVVIEVLFIQVEFCSNLAAFPQ